MIFLILIFSLIIRLIKINQSLWLDEAINVLAAKNYSFTELITGYTITDFHPPLYSALLWFWTKIFGYGEISVRIPSVIFGVATVYLVYLIAARLLSKKYGLIAAALLAINPLHLYYCQEARMYSLAAFSVTLSFFFLIKILQDNKGWIGYLISLILVFGADYVAVLIIPTHFLIVILLKQKSLLFKMGLSLITTLTIWSWWFPFFIEQLKEGTKTMAALPEWGRVVGNYDLKSLVLTYVKFIIGRIDYPDNTIYLLTFLPVGLLFLFLIIKSWFSLNPKLKIIIYNWLIIPLVLAWLISFVVPIYSYFRVLYLLIPFLLIVSSGLYILKNKTGMYLISLVVLVEMLACFIYLSNSSFQREDWRSAVNFLRQNNHQDRQIVLESTDMFAPFAYYGGDKLNWMGGLKKIPAIDDKDLTDQIVGREIFLLDYLIDITDPDRLLDKKLQKIGYTKVQTYNFKGVGFVYKYIKK